MSAPVPAAEHNVVQRGVQGPAADHTVLVLGATGRTGSRVLRQLLDRGVRVFREPWTC